MEPAGECRIISADRSREGIIITFDDGRCAFYSTALLRETLPQAQELFEPDDE